MENRLAIKMARFRSLMFHQLTLQCFDPKWTQHDPTWDVSKMTNWRLRLQDLIDPFGPENRLMVHDYFYHFHHDNCPFMGPPYFQPCNSQISPGCRKPSYPQLHQSWRRQMSTPRHELPRSQKEWSGTPVWWRWRTTGALWSMILDDLILDDFGFASYLASAS